MAGLAQCSSALTQSLLLESVEDMGATGQRGMHQHIHHNTRHHSCMFSNKFYFQSAENIFHSLSSLFCERKHGWVTIWKLSERETSSVKGSGNKVKYTIDRSKSSWLPGSRTRNQFLFVRDPARHKVEMYWTLSMPACLSVSLSVCKSYHQPPSLPMAATTEGTYEVRPFLQYIEDVSKTSRKRDHIV